ncbi:MAG: site-2 protease family protein [Helicobacter sp.]|nr:site-2 protease family protein [Helicobacter sp.]
MPLVFSLLCLVLFASLAFFAWGYFVALFLLAFMVLFHEFGHFLVARLCGVRVEVFSVGFGRREWCLWRGKWGATEYRIAPIMLGGYVQMLGQDDTDPTKRDDSPESYTQKSPLQRIAILLAGPFANLLLGFLALVVAVWIGKMEITPKIAAPEPSSPAFVAGLREGDEIVRVNGARVQSWNELSKAIQASAIGAPLSIEVMRDSAPLSLSLVPSVRELPNLFGELESRPIIGIRPLGETRVVRYGFWDGIAKGYASALELSSLMIVGIGKIFTQVVPVSEVGGVVMAVQTISLAAENSLVAVLWIGALISLNLGIINLLPIPMLDGGHIVLNLYELIARHVPSEKALSRFAMFGAVILFALMALGLYNDISRIVQGVG